MTLIGLPKALDPKGDDAIHPHRVLVPKVLYVQSCTYTVAGPVGSTMTRSSAAGSMWARTHVRRRSRSAGVLRNRWGPLGLPLVVEQYGPMGAIAR